MTAIAALTLNNGETTPVAKTFNPVNIDANGVAKWADRSGGVALGYPIITYSLKSPNKDSRAYKLTAKVTLPVLEQTSPSTSTGIQPAPTLAYNVLATVEFAMPERSTQQQRKDVRAFLANFVANSVVTAGVNDFESVY